ncbi:serine hydrolase domain-containing protein [Ramlibacter humi]|uniref:Class C beta-lactamase-related serine hydrolase n=1 Tax=Ramlibacter humi TaxID=2530451 RepID=A0A4Z0BRB5_9BURK|nr:serine hydrolase [Ramlibacter humi]TFZ01866.1 class C beta-lactamase-related serine hydrolase [Ramlibacter humi]
MKAALAAVLAVAACAAQAEPDEARLGKDLGYPVGTRETWYANPYRVGSWSALDQVRGVLVRRVAASAQPMPLPPMASPPAIRYRYRNIGYSLDEYLERQRTTGLIVLKDGQVVAEHYRYGRRPDARFLSFSMAKSVVSLLVGIANARGDIASLDDPAQRYVKDLEGTAYGATTIRQLLRMSSGLTFTERYDGTDDIARLSYAFANNPRGSIDVLRGISDRHSPAGEKFVYASAETDVLGRVVAGATGRSVGELTQDWLWKPMGAEHEAFWRIGRDGQEGHHGYFNATLRDWARLGLLLAHDGQANGRQVVPRDYLMDATDVKRQPAAFQPGRATPYWGYGYQFWLAPMRERTFALQGVHGQTVYVQPGTGIVLVLTSVWEQASGRQDPQPYEEREALWRGVLQSLGGRPERN